MAKEFGRPGGDDPRNKDSNRNRRQMPEASLHNNSGGEGGGVSREIRRKEGGLPTKPSTPREAFQLSTQRITEALGLVDKTSVKLDPYLIEELADLDRLRGDTASLTKWAQELERDEEADPTIVYWMAATLGDADAAAKVHDSLQTESLSAMAEGGVINYAWVHGSLDTLIDDCARRNLPADVWIDRYAIDANDKLNLKLDWYATNKKEYSHENAESLGRYRNEITDQFLQGDELTSSFSWKIAYKVYSLQEDPEKKLEIFERFQEIDKEQRMSGTIFSDKMFDSFLDFATDYLDDAGIARESDAEWIEDFLDAGEQGFIEAGSDPLKMTRKTQELRLTLDRFYETPPEEIIEKLDQSAGVDLTDTKESDLRRKGRDRLLLKFATQEAKSGNFDAAKLFFSEIREDFYDWGQAKKFFDEIKTVEQLEVVTPDAMMLSFNDSLRRLVETKKVYLGGNREAIAEQVKSFIEKGNYTTEEFSPSRLLFHEGLRLLYQHDKDLGHMVASEIVAEAKDEKPTADILGEIAEIQLDQGDINGFQVLYDHAEAFLGSSDAFRGMMDVDDSGEWQPEITYVGAMHHVHLAIRAAKMMQAEGISFEEE